MSEQETEHSGAVSVSIDELDLENITPGEDATLIKFERLQQQQTLLEKMLEGVDSEVVLFGNRFNVALWSDPTITSALQSALQRNRSLTMKVLVNSSTDLVQSGQQLLELLRRHMPAVECRLRRPRAHGFGADCVVVDRVSYLYIPNPERHTGSASFNGVATATKLLDEFTQEWQLAEPDPELRSLVI